MRNNFAALVLLGWVTYSPTGRQQHDKAEALSLRTYEKIYQHQNEGDWDDMLGNVSIDHPLNYDGYEQDTPDSYKNIVDEEVSHEDHQASLAQ